MKLIDIAAFRAAERAGKRDAGANVFRVNLAEPAVLEGNTRRIRFVFSDSTVDRAGDRIMADGWVLEQFNQNPVALWAHDSREPPIGRAGNLAVENDRLMGDIEFAAADVFPFADTIYRLVLGKFINAVSVGFQPIEYAFVEETDRPWGIDFKRQELLEISVVPIPCNANALAEARSKGIDTGPLVGWAEKLLDDGGKMLIPRTELDALRKAAKPPARARKTQRAEGANETDPTAGGALVGTCGRAADEECGMKDSQECSIHRSDDMDEEKLATMIGRAVKEGIAAGIKAAAKAAPRARRRADGDDENDDTPMQEKALRKAYGVVKAMGDLAEDVADAVDTLQTVVDELDAVAADAADADPAADDAEEQAKARRRKRAAELRRRHDI